jgi:hypothetical protein
VQRADLREGLEVLRVEGLEAELLHGVLQARPGPVRPVAHAVEELRHGLGDDRQVGLGRELVQRVGVLRGSAETAAREHLEAPLAVADPGDEAQVVDRSLRPVQLVAAEPDLELARELAEARITDQVALHPLGVGQDVEDLVGQQPAEGVRRHVAHRVAAGLAGRQTDLAQAALQGLDLTELHEVELDGLPGGHMSEAPTLGRGHVGEGLELRRREQAPHHLHPNHLHVRLTLAVDPAGQSKRAEGLRVHLAGLVLSQDLDELVDVGHARKVIARLAHAAST